MVTTLVKNIVILSLAILLNQNVVCAEKIILQNTTIASGSKIVVVLPATGADIGVAGEEGFGIGVCPNSNLPSGFTPLAGCTDAADDNYGNYQYSDGSIMCFIPKFYYKVGTGSNGFAINVIDVKGVNTYSTTAAANSDGYALHRVFIDGGEEKVGFFIDKYLCSNNAGVASSIQNGDPLSADAGHNPLSDLTVAPENTYAGTIDAAHGRGALFNVASRFMFSALAMLSVAHGQAATSTANCAWYDAGGTTNFPKGCNDDTNGDYDDPTVSYAEDGYLTCGKTGSGTPFAKTTHNGQNSGVADLNGLMYEVSLGLTRPGSNATDGLSQNDATAFYILKESVALKDLQSGWHSGSSGANYEAWGDAAHLAVYYDQITIAQITSAANLHRFGRAANQVLSEATSGTNWLYSGLGIPKDNNANLGTGIALFGFDFFYEYHTANLVVLSCGLWDSSALAGVWAFYPHDYRAASNDYAGFRAACYPE